MWRGATEPFMKIICNLNSFFFPNYLFQNVFKNDSCNMVLVVLLLYCSIHVDAIDVEDIQL